MAEHEIPADLLDKLADCIDEALDDHGDGGVECGRYCYGGTIPRAARKDVRAAVLAALAEWADGTLVDPSTWTRVTASEVGGDPSNPAALYVLTREDHADPT